MMLAKRTSGAYQPAKPYFPERNLRKEADALFIFFGKHLGRIRASKVNKALSDAKTDYLEDRFTPRTVERLST